MQEILVSLGKLVIIIPLLMLPTSSGECLYGVCLFVSSINSSSSACCS